MIYQKHCPGCFRRKDGSPVCSLCGYDESAPRSPMFLPHGAVLAGQYRVGKVLGRPGGFGITYLGWDIYLQQRVAIKEFLPPEMAARVPDALHITVHSSEDRKSFDSGKDQFLREARIVAKLDHPNVVRVRAFFNANDTAYMVMDYYEGMTLDAYFSQVKPTLDMGVASSLTQMLLDGLSYVHERGVVHRDVKPHNIYLAAVGKPILLDFGAARKSAGSPHRSVSVVLTEGYAPLEQYQRNGSLGPWTDVFGVAATLYRMVVGKAPPIAIDRLQGDSLETGGFEGVPEPLKPVLRKALALKLEDRYQTAAEFKAALADAVGAPMVITSPAAAVASALAVPVPEAPGGIKASDLLRDTTIRVETVRISPRAAVFDTPVLAPTSATLAAALLAPSEASLTAVTKPLHGRRAAEQPAAGSTAPAAVQPPAPAGEHAAAPHARARLALPVLAVLVVLLAVFLFRPKPPVPVVAAAPSAAPVAASPALPSRPASQSPPRRFVLDGLPTLAATSLPALREIPGGAYARPGSSALRLAPFMISETEVTVDDFNLFISRSHYENPAWIGQTCEGGLVLGANWENPGYSQTGSHPVVCVSQVDAGAYADWLAQETTRHFRLPTEAEWEYAAAAGAATEYWWGNQIDAEHAACADCGRTGESPDKPLLVTSLGQNAFGLYGTAGNVREWTCSGPSPELAQSCVDAENPGDRVVRGGSWHDPSMALATTYRATAPRSERNTWTGFRIVENLQ